MTCIFKNLLTEWTRNGVQVIPKLLDDAHSRIHSPHSSSRLA